MDLEMDNSLPQSMDDKHHSSLNHDREQRNKEGIWKDIILAYRTLGVVWGGLVCSPLYVYPSMNLKTPTEENFLGIFSIMFWSLTLIGVVKYVCLALHADDQGEGGTFALYSLLCRHVNIGLLPSGKADSKSDNSHTNQSISNKKPSKLGLFLERSKIARWILLIIAMLGMSMLIGDGIFTPSISVLSAMEGLRGPFPSFNKSAVEAASAALLIVLFLLQKFGTSRVSFLFSPIMGAWTLTTPVIGVYNCLRYYPGIFKSLSPHYIVSFFLRNRKMGWELLGGIVLCITGAEAMFADLGQFNRRSMQMSFLSSIYPSLVLTYAGQTAYLIKHPNDLGDGFYKSVPVPVYWPMFIVSTLAAIVASQSLISASFSVVKQSVGLGYFPRVKVVHTSQHHEGEVYSPDINYCLMILCTAVILCFGDGNSIGNAYGVVVIVVMLITTVFLTLVMIIIWRIPFFLAGLYFFFFLILEGVYLSAVSLKFLQGGWLPFAISIFLLSMMFGWYYGRHKKIEYETAHKIDLESLGGLLEKGEVLRVPGLCFFYSNILDGLTPVLGHYMQNMHSLHKVTIFTTFRYLLVAKVDPNERIIIKRFGLDGVYGCIFQYGYADTLNPEGNDFVTRVTKSLQEYIEANSDEQSPISVQEELSAFKEAQSSGVVHICSKTWLYIGKEASWSDRIIVRFYEFLHRNCRSALPAMGIPLQQQMEIGMIYNI